MEFGMVVSWVVVGLLAGWLAGFVMKGGGYGLFGDMVLGLVGSVVGGWIVRPLNVSAGWRLFPTVFVTFVAAVIVPQWKGLGARLRNVNLTSRVTRSRLDLVTLHGPGEVHRRRRSV
jgi:uncharacterized membrane protein YeaQ/YmgE (transglycosylase-associated protein family)